MRFIGIIISCCLLVACNSESPIVENEFMLDNDQWNYDEEFLTLVPIEDTLSNYRLDLALKHSSDFAYANLYIEIGTSFPDGKSLSDNFSLQLADKFGKWEGNCNNEYCTKSFTLRDEFRFKDRGSYKFNIQQYSREETLEGIAEVKLLLYKYPSKD